MARTRCHVHTSFTEKPGKLIILDVSMSDRVDTAIPNDLATLGWKPFFEQQLSLDESNDRVARVCARQRTQLICWRPGDEFSMPIELFRRLGEVTVGDWILFDKDRVRPEKLLDRQTLLTRKAAGETVRIQMMAANIDSLFIVSSCNQDFNLSRIERYLAIALETGANPIAVLTKSDLVDDPGAFRQQVQKLHRELIVETLDARDPDAVDALEYWCRRGQTVAVVGSSGVGKSTLANSLGAREVGRTETALKTATIREDDDKGRHTTTARSLYVLRAGGMLIDNPGIRELQLPSCAEGVTELFDDVVQIAAACRFRDCTHSGEPDCAVASAVEQGSLDSRRLVNYRKLLSEQARNAESLAEKRRREKAMGKLYKTVQAQNRKVLKGRRNDR